MKRKLLAVGLLFFVVILSSAQSYNPYVNQAIISPAPLLPLEFNGTGIASFNIGNTYASDMPLVQNKENTLKISLSKGEPDNPNPVLAVGGTWKNYFNWSYNSSTKTFTAVQNNTLPGAPAVGTITIAYKVTENSNISQINNGFLVNIQPNPDYNGNGNQLADDEAGSYTYVQAVDYGDAPASYDFNPSAEPPAIDITRHEINIFKEAVAGISGVRYTKYIYLGTSVDPETKSEYVPTINADGDDNRGSDDEDGVTIPRLIRGKTVTIPVVVTKHEKSSGKLYAWIDWDANGDFLDEFDEIDGSNYLGITIDPLPNFPITNNAVGKVSTQTINLTFTVPATAPLGITYARFRVGADVGAFPFGTAGWGEVEDYKVLVEENVCAWRTINTGNWTNPAIWEYFDCETNTWKTTTVAPNNDKPIYVSHEVTIQPTDVITADSLYIQPTGKLNACGSLTIDNEIAFVLDVNGNPGELNNCGCSPGGTVELNPTARKIVHRPAGSAWSFMSFPFNVLEQNIFLSGTKVYNVADINDNFSYTRTTQATWGNLTDLGKDFYAVEYDGQKQATDNAAGTSSSNFVNVSGTAGSRVFEALKGYLISNSKNNLQAIDFTSALGEDFKFCTNVTKNLTFYTASGAEPCSEGWNFVGLPYVSSYNLKNATTSGTKYVYQAPNYITVMPDDDKILYPFTSYFVQVFADPSSILYSTTGQQYMKGVSNLSKFDEISLDLMHGTNIDRTRIRLQEDAVANFVYTEDAYKMMSASTTFPQIYTQIDGACTNISVNALPENTQQVQLKIRTGVKGLYTIKLTDAEKAGGISKAILVDKLTGLRTDLLIENSYTFEVTETGESDRFMILFAKDGTTDMPLGNEDGIFVTVKGSKISLKGLKGKAHVNMYDVVGKLLYQYKDIKNNQNFNVYVPGVYLMDIVTETQSIRYKVLIDNND